MEFPLDFSDSVRSIIARTAPFTMTSSERLAALCESVQYIVRCGIPGDIVECGVWRGGSIMAAAIQLLELGHTDRRLFLYDTFDGMTPPTDVDRDLLDRPAIELLQSSDRATSHIWAVSPLDQVRQTVFSTGYEQEKFVFVKGDVEVTLPLHAPENIALLRLDTD